MISRILKHSQVSEDGIDRLVWMFPIRPVPENDVKNLFMFVFEDMDEYLKTDRLSIPAFMSPQSGHKETALPDLNGYKEFIRNSCIVKPDSHRIADAGLTV